MDNITTEEKVDYIYTRLRKQERNEKLQFASRWIFRILIVSSLVYFYQVTIPAFKADIYDKLTPDLGIES